MSAPIAPALPTGAATSDDQAKARYDPDFQQRVEMLATLYALQVTNEGSGIDNHVARMAYATEYLGNPSVFATNQVVTAVVADFLTDASATDSAVLTRIAAVWNSLAGIG